MPIKNEIGNKHGRLTVIARDPTNGSNGEARWVCECDCGNKISVLGSSLRNGHTSSCGCLHKETAQQLGIKNRQTNKYDLSNTNFGIGFTSKNEKFYFDKEDYDLIKNYCWYITAQGYVCCKRQENILMHRLIMGNPTNQVIDHINHVTVDNRKSNLRICSYSQNAMNRKISNSSSNVCGVYWYTQQQKWSAEIEINYQKYHLGLFNNLDEAIKVRKQAEQKYFKEYAYTEERGNVAYDKKEY